MRYLQASQSGFVDMLDLNAPLRAQEPPKTGLLKIRPRFRRKTFVEVTTWQRCAKERRLGGFSREAQQFIYRNLGHAWEAPVPFVSPARNTKHDATIAAIAAAAIAPALDPPAGLLEFID